jgi:hypothetical protein
MSKSSVDERLMKARISLCLTAPYLAGALMQLPISEGPSFISTFATDGFRIYYNRTYAASLTDSEIRGVLCHELLHVLTESRARRNGRDPRLWNVACDYAINAMLLAMGFHLPEGALYKNEFFLLAAEEIYELLKKEPGSPLPHLVMPIAASENLGQLPKALRDDVIADSSALASGLSPRDNMGPVDEESQRILLRSLKKAFLENARKAGIFPSALLEKIVMSDTSVVDWRALLQHWLVDRLKSDWSLFPPSKKALWQGLLLPSVGTPVPSRLVFAVDTSGSMTDGELSQIYTEIRAFRETFPTPLVVVQCDDNIQSVKEYEAFEDFEDPTLVDVYGRGGTDFRPIFKWIDENESGSPSILIHATDGYGIFPKICSVPVLWLLTRNHASNLPDWGEQFVIV